MIFLCFRPHLLSLDLSFNNLADLYHTINVLKMLPKVKNLVLQGNPLAVRNQGCFDYHDCSFIQNISPFLTG